MTDAAGQIKTAGTLTGRIRQVEQQIAKLAVDADKAKIALDRCRFLVRDYTLKIDEVKGKIAEVKLAKEKRR